MASRPDLARLFLPAAEPALSARAFTDRKPLFYRDSVHNNQSIMSILLTVSLFIAVLIVLVRWYKDSEMIVWFTSGLSITNLIGPILRFSIPLIVIIAVLAAVVWPWANRESSIISQRFQQRDDVSMITAGQFKESAKAERVFFIESIEIDKSEVKNIFVADTRNQKLSVAVAATGYIENSPNGDKNNHFGVFIPADQNN